LEGECQRREINGIARRIKNARFPVPKALEGFDWNWPKKINRPQVQNLLRLAFLEEHVNAIFIGGVGLGKTHLATALGREACEKGHSVLFTTAVDIVNTLGAAQIARNLRQEIKRYTRPDLLIIDELGYLPIDKLGGDLLFQVFSDRYERGSVVITTNKIYKHWPSIFNNDATLTSAVLDRLLHHAETLLIEGPSYRMKDRIADV
jgi:DNA replication protein DnaC